MSRETYTLSINGVPLATVSGSELNISAIPSTGQKKSVTVGVSGFAKKSAEVAPAPEPAPPTPLLLRDENGSITRIEHGDYTELTQAAEELEHDTDRTYCDPPLPEPIKEYLNQHGFYLIPRRILTRIYHASTAIRTPKEKS